MVWLIVSTVAGTEMLGKGMKPVLFAPMWTLENSIESVVIGDGVSTVVMVFFS